MLLCATPEGLELEDDDNEDQEPGSEDDGLIEGLDGLKDWA